MTDSTGTSEIEPDSPESASHSPESTIGAHRWLGGLGTRRMVLDHAERLEDALDLFDDHNIDFTGGPGLHDLIADGTGAKAVVECDAGTMQVIRPPQGQTWMCLENVHMSTTSEDQRSGQSRYSICADTLSAAAGEVSVNEAVGLLDDGARSTLNGSASTTSAKAPCG